jgi:hypothetical protein
MAKYKIQEKPFVVPTTDGKLIEEHFGKATDVECNGYCNLAGWCRCLPEAFRTDVREDGLEGYR